MTEMLYVRRISCHNGTRILWLWAKEARTDWIVVADNAEQVVLHSTRQIKMIFFKLSYLMSKVQSVRQLHKQFNIFRITWHILENYSKYYMDFCNMIASLYNKIIS